MPRQGDSVDLRGVLGDQLWVTRNGQKVGVPVAEALDGKYVLLYFSAHWCPPCRAFTPRLAELYQHMQKQHSGKLEVVFVSSGALLSPFTRARCVQFALTCCSTGVTGHLLFGRFSEHMCWQQSA